MGSNQRFVRAHLPFFLCLSNILHFCVAKDTITSTQYITDPEAVISTNGTFKLGFFSPGPGNSTNRYVGIWYNEIAELTVVWVANRDNPLTDSTGVVMIADDGNLVVLDGKKNVLWSTNVPNTAKNTSAKLLESGNLVLHTGISDDANNTGGLWESFGDPSDTMLPTMKLRSNTKKNEMQVLRSWKGDSNPSSGSFSFGLLPLRIPQCLIWNGSHRHYRTGPWNNRIFIGVPNMISVYLDGFSLTRDDEDGNEYLNFAYVDRHKTFVLNSQGKLELSRWNQEENEWVLYWSAPRNDCDIYGKCGPFGSCNALNSPVCSCLRGFEPKSVEEWSRGNWSSGCVRRTQLQCERNNSTGGETRTVDGFLKLENMKVPDFEDWSAAKSVKDCGEECLRNCSCVAYAYEISIGCMSWSGNLIDIQKFSTASVELYIRLANSELDERRDHKVVIITTVIVGVIIVGVFIYFSLRWMGKQRGKKKKVMGMPSFVRGETYRQLSDSNMIGTNLKQGNGLELPLFNFENLAMATNNFHGANKLGKGGFGEVYKGNLPNGQEIAVKRLSKNSGQGIEEFLNEVVVISKLQHRNLVRLLGCCVEGVEKMLIYEYMPNKSLDAFLFDPVKATLLGWRKRFNIIEGIARGLLYLHRDSRLRIIHRDLKASNILLDEQLNPKISDFGMARIFGGTQDEADTRRVVGTYGYMSPEYAMEGRFSEKSDVFSFGVLLLEVVSGKRNTSFGHHPECLSLLGYAWKLWNEDKILELIDPTLYEPCFQTDILRCIHVGLLCIQELAKDRPTVSTIISMLGSEIATLSTPKQPTFIERQSDSSQKSHNTCSINNASITVIEGR